MYSIYLLSLQSFVEMSQPQKTKVMTASRWVRPLFLDLVSPRVQPAPVSYVQLVWTAWDSCCQVDLAFLPLLSQVSWLWAQFEQTSYDWLSISLTPAKAIIYTNSKVQLTCCKLKSKKKWVPSSKNFLYPRKCANHHSKYVTWPSSRTPRWSFLALLEADIIAEGETSMWTDRKHIVWNKPQVSAFFLGIQTLSS